MNDVNIVSTIWILFYSDSHLIFRFTQSVL
jgi:hypothetical protein